VITGGWNGSCGNTWAAQTLRRTYRVFPRNPDGGYTVLMKQAGRCHNLTGGSPGVCNNGTPDNGSTVAAGVRGWTRAYEFLIVRDGTFDRVATCSQPCYAPTFFAFFGASATLEFTS
jgi:hypothetical protein